MKRLLLSILAVAILATGICFAGNTVQANAATITPFWTNIFSLEPSLISASGLYYGTINSYSGTTKIEGTMVLYENRWYGYVEVSRATGSATNNTSCSFYKYYTFTSGQPYRLELSAYVTRNGTTEYASVHTDQTA